MILFRNCMNLFFHFMPSSDFFWQNVIRSSWCLIIHKLHPFIKKRPSLRTFARGTTLVHNNLLCPLSLTRNTVFPTVFRKTPQKCLSFAFWPMLSPIHCRYIHSSKDLFFNRYTRIIRFFCRAINLIHAQWIEPNRLSLN